MKWESKVLGSDGCCLGFSRKYLGQSLAHGTHLLLVLRSLSPTAMTSFTNISGSGRSKGGEERAKRTWPQWLQCWHLPGAILDKTLESSRPQSATGMEVGKSNDIEIETHQEECDILEVANKENADSLLWKDQKTWNIYAVVQSPSRVQLFVILRTAAFRPLCPSPSPKVCPSSHPLHQWCHPIILPSVARFSFCLQSSPASGTFPMSSLFASGDQKLELQLQHQSFQWVFRVDFPSDWLAWPPCSPRNSQESSTVPQLESTNSLALNSLYVFLGWPKVCVGFSIRCYRELNEHFGHPNTCVCVCVCVF